MARKTSILLITGAMTDTSRRVLSTPKASHRDGLNLLGPIVFVLSWLMLFGLGLLGALSI